MAVRIGAFSWGCAGGIASGCFHQPGGFSAVKRIIHPRRKEENREKSVFRFLRERAKI